MIIYIISFTFLVLTAIPAGLAKDPETTARDTAASKTKDSSLDQQIEKLIRELGDKRYAVRKNAADELRKIGFPAVSALEKASQSDDPEVADTAISILKDARLGVSPAWPKKLADDVRRYNVLSAAERNTLIDQVISEMKGDSVPFLLSRLDAGNSAEGQSIYDALKKADNGRIADRLVEALKNPKNEPEGRAAAWAYLYQKKPQEALRVLVACNISGDIRHSVIEKAVETIRDLIKDNELDKAAKTGGEFALVAPSEARFLYLQAAALRKLDKEKDAVELEDKALKLNPNEESPHFSAGEMLMGLGLDTVSIREWEAILKIPPVDDVYDINAYLRLAQIAVRSHHNEEAAKHYEEALRLYRKNKAGGHGGYGMVGMTEDQLEALINRLRQAGNQDGPMTTGEKGKQISIELTSIVKDGKEKELNENLKSCKTFLSANVQPFGFRLLDLKECTLKYDRKKEEISILLNNSDACKPQHHPAGDKKAKIAVTSLDCTYIYEVDPESTEVKLLERFEENYKFKIIPDESLKDFKGSDIKIGEKTYPWTDFLKGTDIDYLPPELEISMEGPGTDNKPEILKFKIKINRDMFKKKTDSKE